RSQRARARSHSWLEAARARFASPDERSCRARAAGPRGGTAAPTTRGDGRRETCPLRPRGRRRRDAGRSDGGARRSPAGVGPPWRRSPCARLDTARVTTRARGTNGLGIKSCLRKGASRGGNPPVSRLLPRHGLALGEPPGSPRPSPLVRSADGRYASPLEKG